uniref:Uncharacterized protein n=1 Tax=Romanomermis culicivorax TaxID=13658 RepID=A0A915KCB3_ROMCU
MVTSTSYDTNFRNEDKRDRNIDIQRSKLPEEFYIDISTNGKDKIIRTYEEQILKIQKDIVAATIECKLDEVDILSKHLNELKLELSKMRAENYTKSSFTLINVNNVSDIRGSI